MKQIGQNVIRSLKACSCLGTRRLATSFPSEHRASLCCGVCVEGMHIPYIADCFNENLKHTFLIMHAYIDINIYENIQHKLIICLPIYTHNIHQMQVKDFRMHCSPRNIFCFLSKLKKNNNCTESFPCSYDAKEITFSS